LILILRRLLLLQRQLINPKFRLSLPQSGSTESKNSTEKPVVKEKVQEKKLLIRKR
jgi:hypothetical protein